jgi:hypothetical protein
MMTVEDENITTELKDLLLLGAPARAEWRIWFMLLFQELEA